MSLASPGGQLVPKTRGFGCGPPLHLCLGSQASPAYADIPSVERRKDERLRCHLVCRIESERKTLRGIVRNVSDGGLRVDAEMAPPSQGQTLKIALRPDGRRPFEVDCLAWHIKKGRKAGQVSLGLVLSNAPDAYFEYVASLRKAPRFRVPVRHPDAPAAPVPAASESRPSASRKSAPKKPARPVETPATQTPAPQPAAATQPMRRHAVQIKQKSSTRMCRLVVAAADCDSARDLTLAEVGSDWQVLDVRAV